jgi:NDP-sugar pyrophosphorylase family protein
MHKGVFSSKHVRNIMTVHAKWLEGGDPSERAVFADGAMFGAGCMFEPYTTFGNKCWFQQNTVFGFGCTFGDNCRFEKDTMFGEKCTFGSGSKFARRTLFDRTVDSERWLRKSVDGVKTNQIVKLPKHITKLFKDPLAKDGGDV